MTVSCGRDRSGLGPASAAVGVPGGTAARARATSPTRARASTCGTGTSLSRRQAIISKVVRATAYSPFMAGPAEIAARRRTVLRAGYVVRPMEVPDAPTVAEVHVRVWRQAYASLMPAEHLNSLDVADLAVRWRERLTNPADGVRHLAGLDPSGRIVAIGTAGPGRDPEPATAWELWAINVLASEHGTGLADLLITELTGNRDCYLC
jgi:hypothetical protein